MRDGKALLGGGFVGCLVVDRLARGVRQPIAATNYRGSYGPHTFIEFVRFVYGDIDLVAGNFCDDS
jgi:hypothetical protein